jgi:hypothetical protein
MKLLKRLKVYGSTVSLMETEEDISIEVHPDCHSDRKDNIIRYLENEGILEEVFSGNTNWEENPPAGLQLETLSEEPLNPA